MTEQNLTNFSERCEKIFNEISRDVIGQKEVVEGSVIAMIAGGNVLLEGVPGVGKTRLVRTLGRVFDMPFSRIQFTPDLMPLRKTQLPRLNSRPNSKLSAIAHLTAR